MTIVVDASVVLKWVLAEDGSDDADALLEADDLVAPSLWQLEVANALWRRVVRRELSGREADERLTELLTAPVATIPLEEVLPAAFRLAGELNHPVYDCLYLALALREDAYVVTADRRFVAAASSVPAFSERVRLLGASAPVTRR